MNTSALGLAFLDQSGDPASWAFFGETLDAAGVGVAVWDAEDRYVFFNQAYVRTGPELNTQLKLGMPFETHLRDGIRRGLLPEAVRDPDAWLADRLARHRDPGAPFEQMTGPGRWYRITERRTQTGGTVGVWVDITDVKRREERLRQSEYRFREFAQSFGNRVWETDAEDRFTYNFGELAHGLPLQALMGRKRWELPGVNPEDFRDYRRLIAQRKPVRGFRYRWRDTDGSDHWFELHGRPSYRDGNFIGYRGVSREVTEQVLAEQAARSAREQLAMAVDNLSENLLLCDPDDRIVVANRAFKRFNRAVADIARPGATYTDFVKAGLARGLFPEAVGREQAWLAEILARRRGNGGSFEVRRNDHRWLLVNEQPLENGWTITVASDITERKLAEEALRESELRAAQAHARLVDAIESMPAGFQLFDADEQLVLANSTYSQWFPEEAHLVDAKAGLEAFVHHAVAAAVNQAVEADGAAADPAGADKTAEIDRRVDDALARIRAATAEPTEIRCPSGRWLQEIDYKMSDGGIIRVIIDITELKQNADQLRAAQKVEAIGQLAGGIAHDFNNILQIIAGFTQLALKDQPPNTTAGGYLETALRAVDRARNLVSQILTFSRRRQVEKKVVSLTPVVTEALEMMRSTLPSTVRIVTALEADKATVLADDTQIQQVLVNLCTNAARAMDEQGGTMTVDLVPAQLTDRLSVSDGALPPGSYFRLSVADTGPGIAADALERIFDPFYTTQEMGHGSGLGLAMVQGIVADHGGGVTVETALGEGSRFSVYLPDAGEPSTGVAPPEQTTVNARRRVLFVDDEPELAMLGQFLLTRAGLEVTTATSGSAALETFREQDGNFDLVITDQTMPGLTGDALARTLLDMNPSLPIILCTGYSETIDETSAKALGIRTLLMKPVAGETLVRESLDLLGLPQGESQDDPDI